MSCPDVSPDSIAGRANAVAPLFDGSSADAGLNPARVHVAGELHGDLAPGGAS
jgi:hypothetical protein